MIDGFYRNALHISNTCLTVCLCKFPGEYKQFIIAFDQGNFAISSVPWIYSICLTTHGYPDALLSIQTLLKSKI